MKNVAEFANEQYDRIFDEYITEYPEDPDVLAPSFMFSVMIGQFISDIMANSKTLDDPNYHSGLLEIININTKRYIDMTRESDGLVAVDWEAGKFLLKEE